MNRVGRETIHALFEAKAYRELYRSRGAALNEMLMIEGPQEFADFLEQEGSLDESIFLLYDSAVRGESLLIGGYGEEAAEKVAAFLKTKLPEAAFGAMEESLRGLYVDIDGEDNLQGKIDGLNRQMVDTGWFVRVEYEVILLRPPESPHTPYHFSAVPYVRAVRTFHPGSTCLPPT